MVYRISHAYRQGWRAMEAYYTSHDGRWPIFPPRHYSMRECKDWLLGANHYNNR